MKEFEIKIKSKKTETVYHAWVHGETLEDAISHADFWNADGDKFGTDYTIEEIISAEPIDYYPYTYEDAVRIAFEKKLPAIHAILHHDNIADFDRLDLISVIVNDDPLKFKLLDTACKDILPDIVNTYLCDDMVQLITDWTDPYEDLTEEDAGRIMGEMEANGYTLPIGFTPKDFLELYHECEPEGDE